MTMKPRIAIVVPARDEAESIPHVLADIPSAYSPRIVVVDNGSNDGTGEVAQRLGAEVVLEQQPGYGIACQAGLRHLAAEPPDIAVILDADHSDYPQDLDALFDSKSPKLKVPERTRLAQDWVDEYLSRFQDTPQRSLGDITPREAAQTRAGRTKVLKMLRSLERFSEAAGIEYHTQLETILRDLNA